MKKPIFNENQRLLIRCNTTQGETLMFNMRWLQFLRELHKDKYVKLAEHNLNKFITKSAKLINNKTQ